MKVMALAQRGAPLMPVDRDIPEPQAGQLLVKVRACGVCRTDLHLVSGELAPVRLPIVPGHEVVGVVQRIGNGVAGFAVGDRVGVPWLGHSCGVCRFCRAGRENLCVEARFTGYHLDGGYAEFIVAEASYAFSVPDRYGDVEAAPLLCAGLIGYRSYRMAGDANRLGLYGFGAAAHLIAQVAVQEGREVYAFTRPGDETAQRFALSLGAVWSGASDEPPPRPLDAAIIFAPAGPLVPEALSQVSPGGVVVCAGIHMSDIPSFPYRLLWEERSIKSVANLTRQDAIEFLAVAGRLPLATHTIEYPLADANHALADLQSGRVQGAAVLIP